MKLLSYLIPLNNGGGKRELTYHSGKRKQIESGDQEAFVSNIRTTE